MTRFDTVFGLAFDIEKDPTRASGFRPAAVDKSSGHRLFGDERLEGFAALVRLGLAQKLIIIGGNEARYTGERPVINRAHSIRLMLIHDMAVDPQRVESVSSVGNTGGNVAVIRSQMVWWRPWRAYAAISNHYHLPRIAYDLSDAGVPIRCFPAEAFVLLEEPARKAEMAERFGRGELAERMLQEAQGIADKLRGTYKSSAA